MGYVMTETSAPALVRGIEILRLLDGKEAISLEDIAALTGFPKSSLTRLLGALEALDLLARDSRTKKYLAVARLVRITETDQAFGERLRDALSALANATGHAAEFYLPGETGMVMTARAEPARGEVGVRARVGYVRGWVGELESAAILGNAFFREAGDYAREGFWKYNGSEKQFIGKEEVSDQLEKAKKRGWCEDLTANPYGVKRTGAVVLSQGKPVGALVVARIINVCVNADVDIYEQVLKHAEELSRPQAFAYQDVPFSD
jgi:DNA-binding IclR family transcriptional regulator